MANIYTPLKSKKWKKSSADMQKIFHKKQEAKGLLTKA